MVNDSKSWDYPNQVSAAQKTALASTPNNLSLAQNALFATATTFN